MRLFIDVEAERIQFGRTMFTGQWVDFYALLALARTEPGNVSPNVTADIVARVGPWRHKAPASVGKEVARHLKQLASHELDAAIAHNGRTRAWRLVVDPEMLHFHPDRESVRAWIEARSCRPGTDDGWLDDLRVLVEVTATLQQGDAESVLARLEGLALKASRVEPAIEAWAALLEGRALHLHDEEDERLYQLRARWLERADSPGRAVAARLRAFLAIRHRFEDPAATLASLSKLAADLELRGDIGSLAVVENAMGLLARRAGDPEAGAAHHLRAAALFGVAGDYPALQGALFNLAICRSEALEGRGLPPDEAVLGLVELCLFICARFGVGNDSAQAEVAGAEWACAMGDRARARMYLEKAEALLGTIDATYDQAYFLEVRAKIEGAFPEGRSNPERDLRAALALYIEAGDVSVVSRIRHLLERFDR